ncbi:hypothetical protein F5877DRAFT_71720 [Lentinula edodes]|nr:hypothetical protein F5877DRAFT_71720 [Lentinula edodes]
MILGILACHKARRRVRLEAYCVYPFLHSKVQNLLQTHTFKVPSWRLVASRSSEPEHIGSKAPKIEKKQIEGKPPLRLSTGADWAWTWAFACWETLQAWGPKLPKDSSASEEFHGVKACKARNNDAFKNASSPKTICKRIGSKLNENISSIRINNDEREGSNPEILLAFGILETVVNSQEHTYVEFIKRKHRKNHFGIAKSYVEWNDTGTAAKIPGCKNDMKDGRFGDSFRLLPLTVDVDDVYWRNVHALPLIANWSLDMSLTEGLFMTLDAVQSEKFEMTNQDESGRISIFDRKIVARVES